MKKFSNHKPSKEYSLGESRKLNRWNVYKKDECIPFSRKENDIFTVHFCKNPIQFNGLTFKTQEHLYKWLMYYGNPQMQDCFVMGCKTAQNIKDFLKNTELLKENGFDVKPNSLFWQHDTRYICQTFAAFAKCKYNLEYLKDELIKTKGKKLVHLGIHKNQENEWVFKNFKSNQYPPQKIDVFSVACIDDLTYEGYNYDGKIWMNIRKYLLMDDNLESFYKRYDELEKMVRNIFNIK